MGTVYHAYDRERHSDVALKTLNLPSEGRHILRFKNEFRLLHDIRHPNLVQIYELIEHEGEWFFTMELLDGVSILDYVRPGRKLASAGHDAPSESDPFCSAPTETVPGPAADADLLDSTESRDDELSRPTVFGPLDLERLRPAFHQLAQGLVALHDAGRIHRDIKPSNIIVTRSGRVVLLDFGIAKRFEESTSTFAGTPRYMAPEQLAQRAVGPAADWFGVGLVLYEALMNRLPYPDDERCGGTEPLAAESTPVSASIPEDLNHLCRRLLAIDPAERPTGTEILHALSDVRPPPIITGSPRGADDFVGRAAELAHLQEALAACRKGIQTTVLACGESGIGKTELVRRFTTLAGERAIVLTGRCHERESVPYKAFDGVVDTLSEHMAGLGQAQAAALVPRDAALLLRAFPVLKRVAALCSAPAFDDRSISPREQRARVFDALRELFQRLASRTLIVVLIEDLHWADLDSFELLREMTRAPNAPALLLLLTTRTGAAETMNRRVVERLLQLPNSTALDVRPLPQQEAEQLARVLSHQLGVHAATHPETIAEEAAGHPLFIHELVRHTAREGGSARRIRLDEAISARVLELSEDARSIVEVVSLAGRPLPQHVVARAACMEIKPFNDHVERLRSENLVRTDGAWPSDSIELYHARFGDVVRAAATTRHAALHRQLAIALEDGGGDAEKLSTHGRGAREPARASHFAAIAAEQAMAALAFDRAARLYRLAIEDGAQDAESRARLSERLGDAFANLRHGREAAEAYRQAAANATEPSSTDLLGRAAAQLLRTGHIDDGITAMAPILESRGIRMPQTPARAILALLVRRLDLAIRHPRLRFRPTDVHRADEAKLARLDLLWSTTLGLFTVDQLRGLYLHARHLALALDVGEPARVARALGLEAASTAAIGGSQQRIDSQLGRAKALAGQLQHPYTEAWTEAVSSAVAYLQGRWSSALTLATRAEALLRDGCPGASWEIDSVQQIVRWSLCYLGRIDELTLVVERGLRDASDRGDLYATMSARSGFPNVVWLAKNDVARATREADDAIRSWSQKGFHLQHLFDLFARVQIDLYAGDGEAALRRVSEKWPSIERSGLLRVELNRILALDLRARAAIACGLTGTGERRRLMTLAATDARALARSRSWGRGLAQLLNGQIAVFTGASNARDFLQSAVSVLDECEMPLHAAAARATLASYLDDRQALGSARAPILHYAHDADSLLAMLAPALRAGISDGRASSRTAARAGSSRDGT
jgi:hypothetical protein